MQPLPYLLCTLRLSSLTPHMCVYSPQRLFMYTKLTIEETHFLCQEYVFQEFLAVIS